MTLLTPGLAVGGLVSIIIPLVVHLLSRRRRRPIEWAAMRFLIDAFRKHHRRLRLQQWLLLGVRCLVVAVFGLALARPVLEQYAAPGFASQRTVFIVIDNSLTSSLTEGDGRSALDRHIDRAVEIVNVLNPGELVGIVTAARPAVGLLLPPSSDHASVVRLLRTLRPSLTPCDLAAALTVLQNAVDSAAAEHDRQVCYLLSEFRTGSARTVEPLPALSIEAGTDMQLLAAPPASESVPNVRVTSVEPMRRLLLTGAADISGQVRINLARTGGGLPADVSRIRLAGPDLPQMEPQLVHWRAGQMEATTSVALQPGMHGDREISLTATIDDDQLQADNASHTVVTVRRAIRVLLLDRREHGVESPIDRFSGGQWLWRALQPVAGGPVEVYRIEPAALTQADVRTVDVVILPRPDLLTQAGWETMRAFVDHEGLLIVLPPGDASIHEWTARFTDELSLPWRVGLERTDHPEGLALAAVQPAGGILQMISADLADLVRPVVAQRRLPVYPGELDGESALVFQDGSPMLLVGRPRQPEGHLGREEAGGATDGQAATRGLVVLSTVAPELSWTNLPSKPLMVPLVHEIIRQGLSEIWGERRYLVGERPVLPAATGNLAGPGGERLLIGEDRRPVTPLRRPGLHRLLDRAEQQTALVAVNVDPEAGNTDTQSPQVVSSWLGASGPWQVFDADNPGSALRTAGGNRSIAGLLLILVLLLVVLETILARRFSYAYQAGVGEVSGGLRPTIEEHPHRSSLRAGPRETLSALSAGGSRPGGAP
ncbi:MAG: BatA domain-containing protein [Phycisphaerales bacterium]|nr:MAG: BatA domain-containing protein [Phycisphaerales bacterium]